jgi:hypothetical protein
MRKRDDYLRQMGRGINIPRLNKEQVRMIKTGLQDLFKHEINPLMIECQPDHADWNGWCPFESAHEESMLTIRTCIWQALNRDTRKICGVQRVNSRLQAV